MPHKLKTRLTEKLNIRHPIVSAPMAMAAGGALAAAVSAAGGLGLIGGGYGDATWLEQQFIAAGNQRIGCGFITWSMARQPHLLDLVLAHKPAAVMLSFGDVAPFADKIRNSGALLFCQVQSLALAREAMAAQADIIIAQGSEAGGHGASRATLTLVPEIADELARHASQSLLLAAGGIGDGRGLAAALNLGADGVLIGSRFWASREALVHPNHHAAALRAGGDDTIRQRATDIARGLDWPEMFTARILQNQFTQRFANKEAQLREEISQYAKAYADATASGDAEAAGVWVGEATGIFHDIPAVAELMQRIIREAVDALTHSAVAIVPGDA